MNPEDIDTLRAISNQHETSYASAGTIADIMARRHAEIVLEQSRLSERSEKNKQLRVFKEHYKRIRVDNIALSHEAAIELVKMINREADLITYEDTVG